MNKSLQKIVAITGLLAVLITACGSSSSKKDSEQTQAAQPVINEDLGVVFRSQDGGYSFQEIPEFDQESNGGLIYLSPPDADPDAGPMLILIGGANDVEKTPQDLLDDFKDGMEDDLEIFNQHDIQLGGKPALKIDYKGSNNGKKVVGTAIFVAVSPTQIFSLIGIYPPDRYGTDEKNIFDDLSETIRFHDLSQADAANSTGIQGEGGILRQWAAYAKASSEYSNPQFSAQQAIGAPDTMSCGDFETAWKTAEKFSTASLEVYFEQPVVPTQVDIYETNNPSQITKVEILDLSGGGHTVYSGDAEETNCPSILSIAINDAKYSAFGIRITVDQGQLDLPWAMIDAVELVGSVESESSQAAVVPDAETQISEGNMQTQTSQSPGGEIPASATGSWQFYSVEDGLADNIIRGIAVAPDDTVWIGNGNKGVSSFKDGKFINYTQADGLGANSGTSVAIAKDGTVWAGTGWGLARLDDSRWTNFTTDQGLLSNDVKTVAIAPDGAVWAGTSSGLSRFDGYSWQNFPTPDSISNKQILDIAFDPSGVVWLATQEGVFSFKDGNWKLYTQADGLSYKFVNSVAVAPDGAMWAATAGQGANRFDGSNWQIFRKDEGLSYNTHDIAVAADGSLWFTTDGYGVYRYNGESFENWTSADGLPSDWADVIAAAPDGSVWVGFKDAGIGRFGK